MPTFAIRRRNKYFFNEISNCSLTKLQAEKFERAAKGKVGQKTSIRESFDGIILKTCVKIRKCRVSSRIFAAHRKEKKQDVDY